MAAAGPHVTRRRRLRPFAPSLLSAVRSNAPTELDSAQPNSGLGKHHTQAYPRTESDTDAVTFLATPRISNRIEPGSRSRRKLKVASRHFSHNRQNASAREACAMSCKQAESTRHAARSLTRSLSKGEKFWRGGCLQSCGLVRQSGALRRTTTMDPRGTRYPSLKPRPSH